MPLRIDRIAQCALSLSVSFLLAFCQSSTSGQTLERVVVSDDGQHFVTHESKRRIVIWGVNYDHDESGQLLDEYWVENWETVVEDFREIKELGANCVRVHLQLGKFMETADKPNRQALQQLHKLVKLAEETELYLDITGLACYHKKNIPDWYDPLPEQQRWAVQAKFWEAVAMTCQGSPAVFCYDLMNEPILAGKGNEAEWLAGDLGGKFFVQRLTLGLNGRTREEVAEAWTRKMVAAIRKHDDGHMITVGVIPWIFVFGGGKPLFYSPEIGRHLDFVSVHFYPKKGEVAKALTALKRYDLGKPLVIEELFPLKCSQEELEQFIRQSASYTDGWISFYWGQTPAELRAKSKKTIADAIKANWIEKFTELSKVVPQLR